MRISLRVVVVLTACSTGTLVSAQVPSQRTAIKLGMPGSEVRRILGVPKTYMDGRAHPPAYVSRQTVGGIPPSRVYEDIYELQTPVNTYELNVEYESDDSESRLHPVPRVIRILLDLDRRMDVNDMNKLLEDLPEAAAFCGVECTVAIGIRADTLYLHPKNLTPIELAEAERIGSLFGMFPGKGKKPTMWLALERAGGSIIKVVLIDDESSLEGPVRASWKPQRAY